MNNDSKSGNGEVAIAETGNKAGKKSVGFIRKYPVLFTALLGIIALVIVYCWKDIQGKKQKAAVEEMAAEQLMLYNVAMLKLVTMPFVWSIRAEMLRDNMEQVNTYTKEMVRERNFQFIHIIDPAGKIIISTDKKLEGQSAADMFEPSVLQTDSIIVVRKDDLLTVAAPVMGYDKKLGVLIMNYIPVKFNSMKSIKTDTTMLVK